MFTLGFQHEFPVVLMFTPGFQHKFPVVLMFTPGFQHEFVQQEACAENRE
jgi:hypothetical protein